MLLRHHPIKIHFFSVAPSVLENVTIPRFDKSNLLHRALTKLSIKAHELAKEQSIITSSSLAKIEHSINEAVAEILGIDKKAMKIMV